MSSISSSFHLSLSTTFKLNITNSNLRFPGAHFKLVPDYCTMLIYGDFGARIVVRVPEVVIKGVFWVIWWSLGQIFLWYIQISLCSYVFLCSELSNIGRFDSNCQIQYIIKTMLTSDAGS